MWSLCPSVSTESQFHCNLWLNLKTICSVWIHRARPTSSPSISRVSVSLYLPINKTQQKSVSLQLHEANINRFWLTEIAANRFGFTVFPCFDKQSQFRCILHVTLECFCHSITRNCQSVSVSASISTESLFHCDLMKNSQFHCRSQLTYSLSFTVFPSASAESQFHSILQVTL